MPYFISCPQITKEVSRYCQDILNDNLIKIGPYSVEQFTDVVQKKKFFFHPSRVDGIENINEGKRSRLYEHNICTADTIKETNHSILGEWGVGGGERSNQLRLDLKV